MSYFLFSICSDPFRRLTTCSDWYQIFYLYLKQRRILPVNRSWAENSTGHEGTCPTFTCECNSPERLHWALLALWGWWSGAPCPTSGDAAGLVGLALSLVLHIPAAIKAQEVMRVNNNQQTTQTVFLPGHLSDKIPQLLRLVNQKISCHLFW